MTLNPPQNDDELWAAIYALTGIQCVRKSVCEGHTAPFDALADAYFARHSIAVWKGSRGLAGKTLQLGLLSYLEGIFLGANAVVLGGSQEQSKRVLEYQKLFWEHERAPRYLLISDPTALTVRLRNGGQTACQAASQRSARSAHPQRLRLDEVDEMKLEIFDAAMGQTMKSGLTQFTNDVAPQTVASSTHQHAEGTMTEILKRAADRGWPVHEWCYRESMAQYEAPDRVMVNGWLTETEKERKRDEVSAEMWRTEYELGEPSAGNRAIDTDKVEAMFRADLGVFEGRPDEYIEIESPLRVCDAAIKESISGFHTGMTESEILLAISGRDSFDCAFLFGVAYIESGNCGPGEAAPCGTPCAGHCVVHEGSPPRVQLATYVHGADWAKEQDWTVIPTFRVDVSPARLVAYLRTGRRPWPQMVAKFDERIQRYPGRAIYDGTGIGNVVKDLLAYRAEPFIMAGRARDDMLSEYIKGVERDELEAPRIRFAYTNHKLATNDAIYGDEHLPDDICAFALAYRAFSRKRRGFGPA